MYVCVCVCTVDIRVVCVCVCVCMYVCVYSRHMSSVCVCTVESCVSSVSVCLVCVYVYSRDVRVVCVSPWHLCWTVFSPGYEVWVCPASRQAGSLRPSLSRPVGRDSDAARSGREWEKCRESDK